jgi:epoxide hydrolase 4
MSDLDDASIPGCPLAHHHADVSDGVRLHYVEAGQGPLVVLLHGFPEFWYSFRLQIPALVQAGFRVVVPDQRGYNLSDKPRDVGAYTMRQLVDDVAALIHVCGETSASVVGHDWGGAIAWCFAMAHPDKLRRLAVLNGPHPASLRRALASPVQLARSSYIFLFQIPRLPEALLRRDRHARLLEAFRTEARPGAFSDADLDRYREAFARPGALTAMLDYYRASIRLRGQISNRKIHTPTLILWGERDKYLDRDIAHPGADLAADARVVYLPDASHWVQHDEPDRVNRELVGFLREG